MDSTIWIAGGSVLASVLVAWLTVRGSRRTEKDKNDTTQMGILLEQYKGLAETYQKDRAEDAGEIAALKAELQHVRVELETVKGIYPIYRVEVRRLRKIIEMMGGDPGPWPSALD